MSELCFCTLLFVDPAKNSLSVNGVDGNFDRQLETFVKCAETLSRSLAHFTGCELRVITNDQAYLRRFSTELNYVEIEFSTAVTPGIKYFAAHYKLDVLRYFARQENPNTYFVLLDSDVICVNPLSPSFQKCVEEGIPTYYNISNLHYPVYGISKIIADKELVMQSDFSLGLWAGGEFIGGTSAYFELLTKQIEPILPRYFEVASQLYHQGDEVVLSVAVEQLSKSGHFIFEVGSVGVVARYWTFPTRHIQSEWESFKGCTFLHLPSDKRYLRSVSQFDDGLYRRVSQYIFWARKKEWLKYQVLRILGKM